MPSCCGRQAWLSFLTAGFADVAPQVHKVVAHADAAFRSRTYTALSWIGGMFAAREGSRPTYPTPWRVIPGPLASGGVRTTTALDGPRTAGYIVFSQLRTPYISEPLMRHRLLQCAAMQTIWMGSYKYIMLVDLRMPLTIFLALPTHLGSPVLARPPFSPFWLEIRKSMCIRTVATKSLHTLANQHKSRVISLYHG